ncbi:MAG TPA: DegT/DnrJ/EryC1/StrS family aminotransferase [Stellaceae bacterium]|nr:DegT/DnrJ/EryC1/StrS family aminotransferase [Stellaceae bacterium]
MSPQLAILGGRPTFAQPMPGRAGFFPARERFVAAFAGIFERQYYTNQGPLAAALERRLAERLEVRHAICVTNGTVGLMMAAEALGLKGRIVLPAAAPAAPAVALGWAGLEPVFCDIDAARLQMTADTVAEALDRADGDAIAAALGVNLWGGAGDPPGLAALAEARGLAFLSDSAHGFGCAVAGTPLGGFGRAEVFSFGPGKIVTATEGGCVTTNDDELAARLRNIRSSYGAGRPVSVVRTANGRMSEAQAAVALLSLDDFEANRRHNLALRCAYEEGLRGIPGIGLVEPAGVSTSNHHYVIARLDAAAFGMGAAALAEVLAAENIGARLLIAAGLHRSFPWGAADRPAARLPGTDAAAASSLCLPTGAAVSIEAVARICEAIAHAQRTAPAIRARRE